MRKQELLRMTRIVATCGTFGAACGALFVGDWHYVGVALIILGAQIILNVIAEAK